ncbi:MAG: HD domain-containing protein [Methylococcales bacterium]|jgi:HD-GYP domain-containing protein (c-di-GMP phosphodiesterase class II)|nr:HD domain-containing protein [Methylococcales bacterium]MBT7409913.1 HD domain-containing protein [Methylococcales bacterium]
MAAPSHQTKQLFKKDIQNQIVQGEQIYKDKIVSSGQGYIIDNDIYSYVNGKPVLLLAKNNHQKINHNDLQKIAKHKLVKPIDEHILPTNPVELSDLQSEMNRIEASVKTFQLPDLSRSKKISNALIRSMSIDRSLLNKISMIRNSDPVCFDHSILSAFLMVEMGFARGVEHEHLMDVFSAGLFHNIGNLYIDGDDFKYDKLTDDSQKSIEGHSVVSYHLLKTASNFSDQMLNSVLDHHEFLDGTGYPRRKKAENISEDARILNIVSCYCSLIANGRSPFDAIKILEVYSRTVNTACKEIKPKYDPVFVKVLKSIVLNNTPKINNNISKQDFNHIKQLLDGNIPEIIETIEGTLKLLNKAINDSREKNDSVGFERLHQNFLDIYAVFNRSGLTMYEDNLNDEEIMHRVLPDIQVVIPEINQSIGQVQKSLHLEKHNLGNKCLTSMNKKIKQMSQQVKLISPGCLSIREMSYLY